jgi:hypothetical protein
LRRVKQAGARSAPSPRLVGIDDWAWRKGQNYDTIVVDLETREVIDLLPDRDAATVSTWLSAHPGIELVSRDRASAYSQAATEAASDAEQVADRWHLLKNVREALKPSDPDPNGTADASPGVATVEEPCPQQLTASPTPASLRREAVLAKRRRRLECFEQVDELHRQGTPIRRIARDLSLSRKAVRRFLNREKCTDWSPRRARRSGMDEHREWADARIAEGRINASQWHGDLAAKGVRLSYATVRRYLTQRLGRAGQTRPRVNAAKPKPTPPPSARSLSFD